MSVQIKVRDLICGIEKNPGTSIKGCTPLAGRISDALIKVSSTRIFAEPEQSFMELPVNSIDSYNRMQGKASVGKFGMGFFSMLYWLAENPKRVLKVISQYRDEGIKMYEINLTWEPTGLTLTRVFPQKQFLSNINGTPEGEEFTGTAIILDCSKAVLTRENVDRAKKHIERLNHVKGISITLNNSRINPVVSSKNVNIYLNTTGISVTDNAEGIPVTTLYNALLIPSSSSKERVNKSSSVMEDPSIVKRPISKLDITVSDIAIVTIEKENLNTANKEGLYFTIPMPSTTTLPVARDDIIYDPVAETNFYIQLEKVVALSMRDHGDVTILLDLLDTYAQKSQQLVLFNLISKIKGYILTFSDAILVPMGYECYTVLKRVFSKSNFVTHPDPPLYRTEEQLTVLLKDYANPHIYKLKGVVTIGLTGETIYETGGLSRFLFVKKSYIDGDPNWSKNLISLTQNTMLIPAVVQITENPLYKQPQGVYNFKDAYNTLIMTWAAKTQNLVFRNTTKSVIADIVDNFIYDTKDQMMQFIVHLNNRVSTIKFVYAYGASPYFTVNHRPIFFGDSYTPKGQNSIDARYAHNNIYNAYEDKFNEVSRRLAYWFISIWTDEPHGSYQIPNSTIAFVTPYIISYIDYRLVDELMIGINSAMSEPELLVFLHFMFRLPYSGREVFTGVAQFCLSQIRHACSQEELKELVVSALIGYTSDHLINVKLVTPVMESLRLFLSIGEIKVNVEPPISGIYRFTCKSLIHYVFNTNKEFTLEDLKDVPQVDTNPVTTKLQMVEIAVNEGTTKDFMQAVLTELVQNSIDAIRGSKIPRGRINVDISKENLSISDNVGIPDQAFLALLIPFLSTKDPNDPNVTGEMGTGFFNVYRQPLSKYVMIDTTLNGRRVTIKATPLVDSSRKVYDIRYSVNITKGSAINGTKITIYFNANMGMIIQSVTDAYIYTLNYLGFTGINTYLNGRLITQKRQSILNTPMGNVYLTDDLNIQSFIMTNNVPFAPLDVFANQFSHLYKRLLNDGNTRVIINFNKNVYTPSQSRTKVNIPIEMEKAITEFINDGLFLSILTEYINNQVEYADSIIENTTSTASIDQLKFTANSPDFLAYADMRFVHLTNLMYFYVGYLPYPNREELKAYPIFDAKLQLRDMINTTISVLLRGGSTAAVGNNLDVDNVMWKAVKRWFSNKDLRANVKESVVIKRDAPGINLPPPVAAVGGGNPPPTGPLAMSQPFTILQPFINAFWSISKSLIAKRVFIGMELKSPPEIVIGSTVNNVSGFYKPDQNIIFLNNKVYDQQVITSTIQKIKGLYKTNPYEALYQFRNNPDLASFFAPNLPVVTLIHEILHAIQAEDHTSSAHGITHITINGKSNLSFDDTAILIYQKVLEQGIIDSFLSR